jgi:PAS domain S-box-containing protein
MAARDLEQPLVPPATKSFVEDIAQLTPALMLKTSPDRFDHSSGSACRPRFLPSGAYVLVGQAGNLKRQRASEAAGFVAVAIAAAAFIGWWTGLPLLASWSAGFPAMKPVAAACLGALGLALIHPGRNSRFAVAVGLAATALAAIDLVGIDFGINRLLVPRAAVPGTNAMAVALGLAGASLALSRLEGYHFAAMALAGLTGMGAVYALLNIYLTGLDPLSGSIEPPALPTIIGLFCVAAGIILQIGTMPALRTPQPLWHLHIVLGCAIITPLLLFGAYAGLSIATAQLRQVRNELMSEARILSAGVDREIVGEIERLQALAASPSLHQGDFAEFQRQAEASLALQQHGNIVLIDRNMQQLVNTFVPFGKPLPKAVAPKPVERTFASGKPQVTGLFMAPVVDQFLYGVTVPVEIDGENRYVLGRSQDQRALLRLVAANEMPAGWLAAVADGAHRIIARSEQEDLFIGKELPPAQWHRAGPGGLFEFLDSEGRPSLQAYVRSELAGWETAVWAPKALLEAPVQTLWLALSLLALLAIAVVVALALWLGRIISRSVGHVARAIVLGEGTPMRLDETPVTEVNTLMAELREAAMQRHAAEQDLQASKDQLQVSKDQLQVSKDRLQLAFDATRLGWWRYDPLRHVGSGDARFKEVFDVTADEISIADLMKRVHPEDAERFWANRQAALDPANPKPYVHHEFRVRWRDGTVRWVEANALAYFEGVGSERRAVSFGGTVQDITERKEREEKEHLLMREVNHRAKNMLSVVDSIAHQTAARNPEDFIECFSQRIQALSANQDLLVRNEWKGVDIADLVRAQLAHFADLVGSRIGLRGPKLRLKPASAQAIGLALHELATNAGKYGALSTDAGRVGISWGTVGDIFTMNWTEREGPPISAPERRGFGTIVMDAMAARSVDGTVHLDYPPSGVTWRLSCSAANALEP